MTSTNVYISFSNLSTAELRARVEFRKFLIGFPTILDSWSIITKNFDIACLPDLRMILLSAMQKKGLRGLYGQTDKTVATFPVGLQIKIGVVTRTVMYLIVSLTIESEPMPASLGKLMESDPCFAQLKLLGAIQADARGKLSFLDLWCE